MFNAKEAIGLKTKNVPKSIKPQFEEKAARAIIHHGGNNVVKMYHNYINYEDDNGWENVVRLTKQDLMGHFPAEIIRDAKFELVH